MRSAFNSYSTYFLLGLLATAMLPEAAMAQALFDSGTNFLEALQDLLTNTWVRIFGVIAVAALGIAWMIGRISFLWAASVTAGLVIAFGAAAIVDSVDSVI